MHLPSIPRLAGRPWPRPLARPFARPLGSLAGLAGFIRDRLAEVSDSLAPLWSRRDGAPLELTDGSDRAALAEAATVIVAAAAPFAPTSFARARLLRQMHASGLLSLNETERAEHLLGVAESG